MTVINLPQPGADYSASNEAQTRRILTQAIGAIPSTVADVPYLIPTGLVGDGVADDTAAIQAALDTGSTVYLPPGIYKTTATLTVISNANPGQKVFGAGATSATGRGSNRTTIRPSSAVSTVFKIDGSTMSDVYMTGWSFEDFAVDMVNMTDATGSVGFDQRQTYDATYRRVRLLNDGKLMRGFYLHAGAFVTQFDSCAFHLGYFNGNSTADAVTTISFNNCDIGSIKANNSANITFHDGAVQDVYYSGVEIVWIPAGKTPYAYSTNTTGLYGYVISKLSNLLQFTSIGTDYESLGGFAATYNDGTHGVHTAIPVFMIDTTVINATFINPTFAGMYLLDYGVNTRLIGQGQSGVTGFDISTGVNYQLTDFRVAGVLSGPVGFAGALGSETSSSYTIDGATGLIVAKGETIRPTADGSYSFVINNAANTNQLNFTTGASIGVLSVIGTVQGYSIKAQPATDGSNVFIGLNAAATQLVNFSTNATPASSQWNFANGIQVQGYSDAFSALKWSLNSSTGAFNTVSTISVSSTQVVTARQTGWTAPTGTVSRATFDQSTVTLPELAKRLAALINDLITHGLIGT